MLKVLLTDEDVCDRPHPLLRHHDPDDDEVAARGDRGHRDEEHRPDELPPPREDVRVYIVYNTSWEPGRTLQSFRNSDNCRDETCIL